MLKLFRLSARINYPNRLKSMRFGLERGLRNRLPWHKIFADKREDCLRVRWSGFFPGRPFEEIEKYYPVEEMKARILKRVSG